MKHADGHVQVGGVSADDDQSFTRVDGPTGSSRGTRIGHSNVTLRLRSDLVDLDSSLADDCSTRSLVQVLQRQATTPHSLLPTSSSGIQNCWTAAPGPGAMTAGCLGAPTPALELAPPCCLYAPDPAPPLLPARSWYSSRMVPI